MNGILCKIHPVQHSGWGIAFKTFVIWQILDSDIMNEIFVPVFDNDHHTKRTTFRVWFLTVFFIWLSEL